MENDPSNFFETGQSSHIIGFCIFGGIIVSIFLWGIVARFQKRKSYFFGALCSVVGLAVFFYSENLMHGTTGLFLRSQLLSGEPDFFERTRRAAKFETALAAYSALAFFAQVFAAALLLIHVDRKLPNKAEDPTRDSDGVDSLS